MKCEKCIWSDRRPGNKIVCPFLRCVHGDGWTVYAEDEEKVTEEHD